MANVVTRVWAATALTVASTIPLVGCYQTTVEAVAPCRGVDETDWREYGADVDLLFVIDTSSSMEEEQAALRREIPRVIDALVSGDRDDDGAVDFTPLRSLHAAVITTDLGGGRSPYDIGCVPGSGQDGRFVTSSRRGTCMRTFESGLFRFDRATDDASSVAADVACVIGASDGCGLEQPLEAALKALAPAADALATLESGYPPDAVTPRFTNTIVEETEGHGLRFDQRDFLRPDSVLAIVVLSDEDDCSLVDQSLVSGPNQPLTAICARSADDPARLRDLDRYIDGFASFRVDPSRLVFVTVSGVPDAGIARTAADLERLLDEPEMRYRYSADGRTVQPACRTAGAEAVPSRRLVGVAAGLAARGAAASAVSICGDLSLVTDALVGSIASRFDGCRS